MRSLQYIDFFFFQRDDWVPGGCVIEEDSPEDSCDREERLLKKEIYQKNKHITKIFNP